MKPWRLSSTRFLLVILLIVGWNLAFAQIRSGTIVGTVTDPSGAAVVNAQVEVVQNETQGAYRTTTNAAGEYTVPYLQSDTYTITVTARGFPVFRVTELGLEPA